MKRSVLVLMAMLVLTVFAVGMVSAEENVTADIDVPTEEIEIDDAVVEDVESDEGADADVNDEPVNLRGPVHVDNTMTLSQIQTTINNAADGSTIYFDNGTYDNVALNLRSNIVFSGYGAKLNGNGANHIFTLPNDMDNFTICGFEFNVNDNTNEYSAIYGSFITNGRIAENTMYGGANGVNINKFYNNTIVEDNVIYNMTNDGISFAHPNANSNINTLGNSYISRNRITNCTYGIFIGGNFRGVISDNNISSSTWGIQSAGKKNGLVSNIVANISGNRIVGVQTGIEFINMTAISLNISSNYIQTLDYFDNYTIDYLNFSNATTDSINLIENVLSGAIKRSFLNMAALNTDWFDGEIKENL